MKTDKISTQILGDFKRFSNMCQIAFQKSPNRNAICTKLECDLGSFEMQFDSSEKALHL